MGILHRCNTWKRYKKHGNYLGIRTGDPQAPSSWSILLTDYSHESWRVQVSHLGVVKVLFWSVVVKVASMNGLLSPVLQGCQSLQLCSVREDHSLVWHVGRFICQRRATSWGQDCYAHGSVHFPFRIPAPDLEPHTEHIGTANGEFALFNVAKPGTSILSSFVLGLRLMGSPWLCQRWVDTGLWYMWVRETMAWSDLLYDNKEDRWYPHLSHLALHDDDWWTAVPLMMGSDGAPPTPMCEGTWTDARRHKLFLQWRRIQGKGWSWSDFALWGLSAGEGRHGGLCELMLTRPMPKPNQQSPQRFESIETLRRKVTMKMSCRLLKKFPVISSSQEKRNVTETHLLQKHKNHKAKQGGVHLLRFSVHKAWSVSCYSCPGIWWLKQETKRGYMHDTNLCDSNHVYCL
jgi:hypothetical protein